MLVTFALSLFWYPLGSRRGDFIFGSNGFDLLLWFAFKGRDLDHGRGCWELQELEHRLILFDILQSLALYKSSKLLGRYQKKTDTVARPTPQGRTIF